MSDRHVTTDATVGPGVCGCGCGRPRPAAPPGGGRAPRYASRACQQRAYRARQPTPVVDPPSVAALLRDIRALAAALDAGEHIPADLTAAVRAGTRDLLARAATRPAPPAPPRPDLHLVPPAPPTPRRSSRDDRRGERPAATTDPATPVPARHRRPRPVVLRDRGLLGDGRLGEDLSAAVRAVHHAPDAQPVLAGTEGGWTTVTLDGVTIGSVAHATRGRGWQARLVDGVDVTWRGGRRQDAHPTRIAAIAALRDHLTWVAGRATPASLRTR